MLGGKVQSIRVLKVLLQKLCPLDRIYKGSVIVLHVEVFLELLRRESFQQQQLLELGFSFVDGSVALAGLSALPH